MNLIDTVRTARHREAQASCTRRGFYLVKGDARHWISETVSLTALERVCDRVLSDREGWEYWIDYSYGVDVTGSIAWANIDQTDRFF